MKKKEINIEKIKKSVKKALARIENHIDAKRFALIILDEVLDALGAKFISKSGLKRIIKKNKNIELVLTGRHAPRDLIAMADYVSQVKKIKHPYDKKAPARKSIEY